MRKRVSTLLWEPYPPDGNIFLWTWRLRGRGCCHRPVSCCPFFGMMVAAFQEAVGREMIVSIMTGSLVQSYTSLSLWWRTILIQPRNRDIRWIGESGQAHGGQNISSMEGDIALSVRRKTYSLFPPLISAFQPGVFYIQKTRLARAGDMGTAGTLGIAEPGAASYCHFQIIFAGHDDSCLWLILGPSFAIQVILGLIPCGGSHILVGGAV